MEHEHCCHDHDCHDHDHPEQPHQGHGCGGCGCGGCSPAEIALDRPQAAFLARFAQTPFLPLTRFLYRSSKEEELESVGLSAVFLEGGEDLAAAKATGALLEGLEELGLITLDYDITLSNFDYSPYEASPLFAQFRAAVAEGAGRPGFLFDTPVLEKGSMALTDLGQAVMEQVLELL